jgi:hypothetical protein
LTYPVDKSPIINVTRGTNTTVHMLKRLFTVWLILSLLGLGAAWAFDRHAAGGEHEMAPGTPAHESGVGGEVVGCDHCCHLGAHLMGMCSSNPEPILGGHELFAASPEYLLLSASHQPPLRPPRA